MEKKILSFNISENIADMFLLAASISGVKADDVFENFAKKYAEETLCRLKAAQSISNFEMHDDVKMYTLFNEQSNSKVLKKIPLWARKLNQINSQLIRVFFMCEKNETASREQMRTLFLQENPDKTYFQFENNLNSMGTDKGNSHGHVFDFYGDEVCISKVARDILLKYKNVFLPLEKENNILCVDENDEETEYWDSLADFETYSLLDDFKLYCKTPGITSGKMQSYANAILYIYEFLGAESINQQVVNQFKYLEKHIYNEGNEINKKLLKFLSERNQKSYLTGGFIKAALSYFYPFWEEYKNKLINKMKNGPF